MSCCASAPTVAHTAVRRQNRPPSVAPDHARSHLMPGREGEASGLLDAYLERADRTARIAQVAT